MKRLVAVLLVLVGTAAMSFACRTQCKGCGNEWENTCLKYKERHVNSKIVSSCYNCPTCSRCTQQGHTSSECTSESYEAKNYDKGYHSGLSGDKNTCNTRSKYLDDCDRGYRNGVSDLNAAKRGEFSSEE